MVRGADDSDAHVSLSGTPHLKELLARGYIAESETAGSASVSLEDETADFSVSRMATALGDKATADRMLRRSANWRKLFDPDTRYIRPRMATVASCRIHVVERGWIVEAHRSIYVMVPSIEVRSRRCGRPGSGEDTLDSYFSQYGNGMADLILHQQRTSSEIRDL